MNPIDLEGNPCMIWSGEQQPPWLTAVTRHTTVHEFGEPLHARLLESGASIKMRVPACSDGRYAISAAACALDESGVVSITLDGKDFGRKYVRKAPYHTRIHVALPSDGEPHTLELTAEPCAVAFWRFGAGCAPEDANLLPTNEIAVIFADHGVQQVPSLPHVLNPRPGSRADGAHTHPDANSFLLFRAGDPLVMDDGYPLDKQTRNHSTLLVDGQSQVGSGEAWPEVRTDKTAAITHSVLSIGLSAARGEAHELYDSIMDLERCARWVVSFGERWFVIYDEVIAGSPRSLEWLLITGEPPATETNRLKATFGDSALTVAFMHPNMSWSTEPANFNLRPGYKGKEQEHVVRNRARPSAAASQQRILAALLPSSAGIDPVVPTAISGDSVLGCSLRTGEREDIVLFSPPDAPCCAGAVRTDGGGAAMTRVAGRTEAFFVAGATVAEFDGETIWSSSEPATIAATWDELGVSGDLSVLAATHVQIRAWKQVEAVSLNGQRVAFDYDVRRKMVGFDVEEGDTRWQIL
ncbi:MAG: heparinase II/III family protein [Capsulimonadaceae bacterium]|nr:heparinase II/III family protein [Capsulimonadaceae bacterium]